MFIIEIVNNEVHIVREIFVLSGALIFPVGFLEWETTSFYIICPNGFQSICGLCLLLRSWFPTGEISLLSGKLRSGSRLISFHYSHMVHKLILHLNELSIHLVYLLSQESNRIMNMVVGNFCSCFYLGTRVLKRFYFLIKEILLNVDNEYLSLCQWHGLFIFKNVSELSSKAFM